MSPILNPVPSSVCLLAGANTKPLSVVGQREGMNPFRALCESSYSHLSLTAANRHRLTSGALNPPLEDVPVSAN